MSNSLLRIVLAVVIGAHGIGHVLFLFPLVGSSDWGQSTRSWLLTNAIGGGITNAIGAVIWIAATIGFVAAVVGMFAGLGWWRPAMIISSLVSLAGLLIYWANPPSSSAVFAGLVDVLVVVSLLVLRWPTVDIVGA